MRAIDHYAWSNRWRDWHPAEKLLPAGCLLILTLVLPPLSSGPLILASMAWATVYGAGVPARALLQVLAAPAAFLVMGAPFLAVSISFADGFHWQWSSEGWRLALETTVRALAAVSCLAFLTLTTPLTDLIALSRRLGVPAGLVELVQLVYRLIFVFAERAITGQQAQAARLGYIRFDRGLHSVGGLAGNLFQRALHQAQRMEIGLAARGYTGELRVLNTERALSWSRLMTGITLVGLLGLSGWTLGRGGS